MYHAQRECRYSSKSLDGLEFIDRYIFNKLEYIRYNSTLNQFIGYTEHGVKNAERLNKDPAELAGELSSRDTYCKPNAGLYYNTILDKTAEPYIRLRSEKPFSPKHPAMLVCSVFGFYPKPIKVTWLRNGQTVGSDVTSTEELSDGDWYYQIHSHLEYTPESGETISCKVEHGSFPQPREVKWDPSMPGSDRNKVIIGASGLVLGLVIAAAGGVYYKKKSTGES
ncbi:HB2D protein, partial [Amia calva]|nr:HB2D protein [Amia calva]